MSVAKYLSLVKFSHTLFALPFALIGYALGVQAAGFDWLDLVRILLCMVFARNAAMGFNRLIDRRYDARNPRTAVREIPAGKITPRAAGWFVAVNVIGFIAVSATFNLLTLLLSPVALAVVLGYSYTKRFTSLCHMVLGVGLAIAPSAAYIAVTGTLIWLPVLFSVLVFTWVSGFDIIYALQDVDFDRSQGLHSVPARLGIRGALAVSIGLHLVTAALAIGIGCTFSAAGWYWIGTVLFLGLLFYQHGIVRPNDLSRIGPSFGKVQGASSVLFAAFVILQICYS